MLEELEACGARKVYTRLDPAYGSCDIGFEHARAVGADLILHFGHRPYPYPLCVQESIEVEYVNVEFELEDVERLIEATGCSDCLACIPYYSSLCKRLIGRFSRLLTLDLLGCYVPSVEGCGCVVVVGSMFHALGVALAAHLESRVILVDPSTGRVEDVGREARRVLSVMYHRSGVASEKERWGVILGVKPGQCRVGIAESIVEAARRRGKRVTVLTSSRLTRSDLDSIPEDVAEVFVVTSCPRLAVEDLLDYWRPVLTPGEALYALGARNRIHFPW